ncbi:hypothetical protein [Actinocorallia populi]|uniref:hypothetical protein n=1 Tax=Actinocorallia populi TaxID=2079200 RepID=UPI0013001F63|nr:hypothetical protein [Actinocorallia populi]
MTKMKWCGSLIVSLVVLSGCSSVKLGGLMAEEKYSIAHPKDVAAKVGRYGKEILDGLAIEGKFNNPNISPSPCGSEYNAKRVPGRNLDHETWWVGHSPYSEALITYVEVPSAAVIGEALTRLKAALEGAGWRTVEFGTGSATSQAVLRIAAPEEGYGAVLQGITTVPGSPRIGVNVSSPCLRHPEAE